MYAFSKSSLERLATCHGDIQKIWRELSNYVDCSVLCGHRDELAQNDAYDNGFSEVMWPDSKHNPFPSMAIDSGPYSIELGNVDYDDHKAFAKFAGYVDLTARQLLGRGEISHLIRWGGDWDMDGRTNDQLFNDLPHFELVKP